MSFTGQLGTADSQLAKIVLGTVAEEVGNILEQDVNNSFVMSQTVGCVKAYVREVDHTITFAQHSARVIPQVVEQSLTFSQIAAIVKIRIVPQTITFSQSVTVQKRYNRTVVQGLFLAHTRSYNQKRHLTVQHTLLSQQVVGYRNKPIKQTITFNQSVTVVKRKAVKQSLIFDQSIAVRIAYGRQINTLFQPFQAVARSIKVTKRVTQALGIIQQVVAFNVKGVTQPLTMTQVATANVAKGARNSLNLQQSVAVQCLFKRTVQQSLTPVQTVSKAIVLVRSANSVLAFDQVLRKKKFLHHSATNTLVMTSTGTKTPYRRSLSHTLTLSDDVSVVRVLSRTILQQLNFNHNVARQMAYSRSVASQLSFKTYRDVPFGINQQDTTRLENLSVIHLFNDNLEIVGGFYAEDIYGNKSISGGKRVRNPRYIVLSVPQRTIVLPAAEFGDGENNEGIFSLRRAMDGTIRTYVKTTLRTKLSYKLVLSLDKSEELEDFIWNYNSSIMTLVNWKNEIWRVQLQRNPIELTPERRWINAKEAVTVDLDFEGIKLN